MLVDQTRLNYETEHGKYTQLITTELTSKQYGLIIISTVITATGSTRKEGFFTTYESKVFNQTIKEEMYVHQSNSNIKLVFENHIDLLRIVLDKILQK
jgi:hypothetical protein